MPTATLKKEDKKVTEDTIKNEYKYLGKMHWSKLSEEGFRIHVIGLQSAMLNDDGIEIELTRKVSTLKDYLGYKVVGIFDKQFVVQKFIQVLDQLFKDVDDYEKIIDELFDELIGDYTEHKKQQKEIQLAELKALIRANNLSLNDLKKLAAD